MGMFNSIAEMSGLGVGGYVNEADLAEEMERLEEMPAAEMAGEDVWEMYVEAAIANEKNFNTIMMSIANEEFQYFIENGTEMVYEGARLDAFFDKCKDLLDRAWQKIKAIFEKALSNVKAWTASDSKFVQKYGDKIKKASGEICHISDSYDINIEAAKANGYSGLVSNTRDAINALKKGKNKSGKDSSGNNVTVSDLNKYVLGMESKDEFLSAVKKAIGMGERVVVKSITGPDVVEELKEGKSAQKNIKMWYNDAKKAVAGMKKQIQDEKREASKKSTVDDTIGAYSQLTTLCNTVISAMNGLQSIQLQAVKIYHSNCRAIARRVVSGKTYKESAELNDFADLLV